MVGRLSCFSLICHKAKKQIFLKCSRNRVAIVLSFFFLSYVVQRYHVFFSLFLSLSFGWHHSFYYSIIQFTNLLFSNTPSISFWGTCVNRAGGPPQKYVTGTHFFFQLGFSFHSRTCMRQGTCVRNIFVGFQKRSFVALSLFFFFFNARLLNYSRYSSFIS